MDSLTWDLILRSSSAQASPTREWVEIGHARSVPRYILAAVILNRNDLAAHVFEQLDLVFQNRDEQDGFPYRQNGRFNERQRELARLLSVAFFMVELLQALHAARALPRRDGWAERLQPYVDRMRPEAGMVVQKLDDIMVDNLRAANRLMLLLRFATLAEATYQVSLESPRDVYIRGAVSLMTNDGYFLENGGGDVSYQGAGLLSALLLLLVRRIEVVETVTRKGLGWLEARISSEGHLQMEGSTRTAGQDRLADGMIKPPNIREIASALSLGATLMNDPLMQRKAMAAWSRYAVR
ncbi:hypothetical protein [Roseomonas populi]|uniref:Uncharacterized protein n=1 Tax=Roseomonas populi TaxID=3121582 RepID=A0ABT1XCW5_9PROT|nr:hypothetical protein [Roseomonas pecuniae]MCR0985554.1 hypothetical protein [Roseomonas pecuniae]